MEASALAAIRNRKQAAAAPDDDVVMTAVGTGARFGDKWTGGGSSSPRNDAGFCGLVNQGATCYLNSLLQTLYCVDDFRCGVFGWRRTSTGPVEGGPCISGALQHLFAELTLADRYSLTTTGLTRAFGWTAGDAWVQHDVHEAVLVLIDALEQQGLKHVSGMMSGRRESAVECTACGSTSVSTEPFTTLELPVVGCGDIGASLRSFLAVETLEGDNAYACGKCAVKTTARKGLRLPRDGVPPLLFLQLQRFAFDMQSMGRRKVHDPCAPLMALDLRAHVYMPPPPAPGTEGMGTPPAPVDLVYDCTALLMHTGSATGGHYFAYVRRPAADVPGLVERRAAIARVVRVVEAFRAAGEDAGALSAAADGLDSSWGLGYISEALEAAAFLGVGGGLEWAWLHFNDSTVEVIPPPALPRALGQAEPLPVPVPAAMLDALARAAEMREGEAPAFATSPGGGSRWYSEGTTGAYMLCYQQRGSSIEALRHAAEAASTSSVHLGAASMAQRGPVHSTRYGSPTPSHAPSPARYGSHLLPPAVVEAVARENEAAAAARVEAEFARTRLTFTVRYSAVEAAAVLAALSAPASSAAPSPRAVLDLALGSDRSPAYLTVAVQGAQPSSVLLPTVLAALVEAVGPLFPPSSSSSSGEGAATVPSPASSPAALLAALAPCARLRRYDVTLSLPLEPVVLLPPGCAADPPLLSLALTDSYSQSAALFLDLRPPALAGDAWPEWPAGALPLLLARGVPKAGRVPAYEDLRGDATPVLVTPGPGRASPTFGDLRAAGGEVMSLHPTTVRLFAWSRGSLCLLTGEDSLQLAGSGIIAGTLIALEPCTGEEGDTPVSYGASLLCAAIETEANAVAVAVNFTLPYEGEGLPPAAVVPCMAAAAAYATALAHSLARLPGSTAYVCVRDDMVCVHLATSANEVTFTLPHVDKRAPVSFLREALEAVLIAVRDAPVGSGGASGANPEEEDLYADSPVPTVTPRAPAGTPLGFPLRLRRVERYKPGGGEFISGAEEEEATSISALLGVFTSPTSITPTYELTLSAGIAPVPGTAELAFALALLAPEVQRTSLPAEGAAQGGRMRVLHTSPLALQEAAAGRVPLLLSRPLYVHAPIGVCAIRKAALPSEAGAQLQAHWGGETLVAAAGWPAPVAHTLVLRDPGLAEGRGMFSRRPSATTTPAARFSLGKQYVPSRSLGATSKALRFRELQHEDSVIVQLLPGPSVERDASDALVHLARLGEWEGGHPPLLYAEEVLVPRDITVGQFVAGCAAALGLPLTHEGRRSFLQFAKAGDAGLLSAIKLARLQWTSAAPPAAVGVDEGEEEAPGSDEEARARLVTDLPLSSWTALFIPAGDAPVYTKGPALVLVLAPAQLTAVMTATAAEAAAKAVIAPAPPPAVQEYPWDTFTGPSSSSSSRGPFQLSDVSSGGGGGGIYWSNPAFAGPLPTSETALVAVSGRPLGDADGSDDVGANQDEVEREARKRALRESRLVRASSSASSAREVAFSIRTARPAVQGMPAAADPRALAETPTCISSAGTSRSTGSSDLLPVPLDRDVLFAEEA